MGLWRKVSHVLEYRQPHAVSCGHLNISPRRIPREPEHYFTLEEPLEV